MSEKSMEKKEIVICSKCKTVMSMDPLSHNSSTYSFYGPYDTSTTSVATVTSTSGTRSAPPNSCTSQKFGGFNYARKPIKIRNYTCPKCGWKKQKRE